jgi:hypothetical protein
LHVLWSVPGRIARFVRRADEGNGFGHGHAHTHGHGNGNGNGNGDGDTTRWPRIGMALPALADCQPFFEREMARARRYERPLGIVVHDFDPVWEFAPELAHVLVQTLRITDLAALDATRKHIVVLLPETDRLQAETVAARLRRLIPLPAPIRPRVGTAVFPADALILDELVAVAARARGPAADPAVPTRWLADEEGAREGLA